MRYQSILQTSRHYEQLGVFRSIVDPPDHSKSTGLIAYLYVCVCVCAVTFSLLGGRSWYPAAFALLAAYSGHLPPIRIQANILEGRRNEVEKERWWAGRL